METTLIIKNILLPKLEKDQKFSEQKVNSIFWGEFTANFVRFEEDPKPVYALISSLELANAEKVIDKLPTIYIQFLKELAESSVLGQTSDAIDYLLKTNNEVFIKEVHFLQKMQQAIKSVERKRIKADLPTSYERLTFELSETDLTNVIKKKGREDLREKMKQWDSELQDEVVPVITMKPIEPTKGPPFYWIRYAVAACVVLATGIFFFRNNNPVVVPTQNSVVTTDDKKETTVPQKTTRAEEVIVLADIETISEKITIQQPESMGFSGADKHKITINYKDASKRIVSLEKVIETSKAIDSKILIQYKTELASLNKQKNKYVFDGKELTLFMKKDKTEHTILLTEDQAYFLKKGKLFYYLKISKVPFSLETVSDGTTIETLEKIHFANK